MNAQPPETVSRNAGAKMAEWVSLGISTLIVVALAGYLLVVALREKETSAAVQVEARIFETREVDGRFILPVRVVNPGQANLRDLSVEISQPRLGGLPEPTALVIDLLGGRSEETVFFSLKEHPATSGVTARVASYRVD